MNRRKYLQGLGGMALGGMTALAGCSTGSDGDNTVGASGY